METAGTRPAPASAPMPAAATLLAAYQCADCPALAAEQDPFVADSEAEALWMWRNAFPTHEQRAWTDRVSLAEVESRALREGGEVWALELVRKRCAVGEARHCFDGELGRALLLADDGRMYARYVLAESYARIAESGEGTPFTLRYTARQRAPQMLLGAALRGDWKAEEKLTILMGRARQPWTADELQAAFFNAISLQRLEAAHAAVVGPVPRQWPPRPSRSHDNVLRMKREWIERNRAAHSSDDSP